MRKNERKLLQAEKRIKAYLDRKQLDTTNSSEHIHSYGTSDGGETALLVSDIELLLIAASELPAQAHTERVERTLGRMLAQNASQKQSISRLWGKIVRAQKVLLARTDDLALQIDNALNELEGKEQL